MKRTIGTSLLVIALAIPMATAASSQEVDFTDVEGTTHETAILAIAQEGVISGYPDGTFRPNQDVTRGQLATFFTNALDLPEGDPSQFSDIAGNTHEAAIGSLASSGITSGYPDGTFRPNNPTTRGQLATFLAAGFELPDDSNVYFEDARDTTHDEGIAAVTGAGFVSGFPDGTFRPTEPVTRGQLSTFVGRAMGLVDTVTPPEPLPEPEPARFPLAPSGATFGNGIHTDVSAGTYRSGGTTNSGCYWARLSGTSGTFEEIITNNNSTGPTLVTIADSDAAFESTRCQTWQAVQDTYPSSPADSFDDGTYVVGEHIQPGTYTTGASDGCYYARLSGFGKVGVEDIIINNITDDPVTLTIPDSDLGFTATRCGTWTRE